MSAYRTPVDKPEEKPFTKLDGFTVHRQWLATIDVDLSDITQCRSSNDLAILKNLARGTVMQRFAKGHEYRNHGINAVNWLHLLTLADCAKLSEMYAEKAPEPRAENGIRFRTVMTLCFIAGFVGAAFDHWVWR